eukprot:m51a1_g6538 hypothetical protein (647) ;mRNA; r:49607-52528
MASPAPTHTPGRSFEARPVAFRIELSQDVFFSGQSVAGRVVLSLSGPKLCRHVYVQLSGESYARDDSDASAPEAAYQRHPFLELRSTLWTSPHAWAFSLGPLPPGPDLPASLHADGGGTRYVLRAGIARPRGLAEHRAFRAVTALPLSDANDNARLLPVTRQDAVDATACCCVSGEVLVTAVVPAAAWVPGDVVPVHLRVANRSGPRAGPPCAASSSTQVFFSGQSVAGRVVLSLSGPKLCRHVYVQLSGESYARDDSDASAPEAAYQRHPFLELRSTLWTSPVPAQGLDCGALEAGEHAWAFSLGPLPPGPDLPASLHADGGGTRYVLRAGIARPRGLAEHRAFRAVTALPLSDANDNARLLPVTRQDAVDATACCCVSGEVLVTAVVPAAAWVPGDVVPVHLRVANRSGAARRAAMRCQLVQCATVWPRGAQRARSAQLACAAAEPVRLAKRATCDARVELRVPACCPTVRRTSARLVDVAYHVLCEVFACGCQPVALRLPVEVATVPRPSGDSLARWCSARAVLDAALSGELRTGAWVPAGPFKDEFADSEPGPEQLGPKAALYPYYPAIHAAVPAGARPVSPGMPWIDEEAVADEAMPLVAARRYAGRRSAVVVHAGAPAAASVCMRAPECGGPVETGPPRH